MPKGEYLQYGGQAIVEGVMMRSPRFFSVACRAPNKDIIVRTEAIEKTWIGRQKWLKLPFLRGSLALLDSMALGIRAMRFATNIQIDPAYQPVAESDGLEVVPTQVQSANNKRIQEVAVGATMVVSLGLGLFLFQYLPNVVAEFARGPLHASPTMTNVLTEIIKIVFFFGYIALIGQLPDIKEVFRYHGAEHKAINVMEADQELNMQNSLAQTRLHPRCGTSFAIIVLIVSFVFFTFLPRYLFGEHAKFANITIRVAMEIVLLMPIAGISYELLRLAGKFRNTTLVNIFFAPGLMSQYLTTREPEEKHVEVALLALKACIDAEERGFVAEEEATTLVAAPSA